MSVIMARKSILFGAAVLFLTMAFTFTTCNSPMGMGDPIDWEPPELTLDPGPNPRYVKLGTVISGTVKDNVAVSRVIMRDAISGEQYSTARLLPNDRWEMILDFDDKDNGEKLSVEIVAYDLIGNASVVNMTIIVDLSPPVVLSAEIERSPAKIAYLEAYSVLFDLERTDPRGEKNENMHRYQNGWFNFRAKLNEDETRINKVVLNIYDSRDFETPLYSKEMDPTTGSLYSPKWLIKEEELLNKGVEVIGPNYKTDYYKKDNGARYYYMVSITSFDLSENEGTLEERVEDQLYFCMWEEGDVPKGLIDPIIGNTIYKKMPLPIQFFDDDSLDYAYAGLLTNAQWLGEVSIADGNVKIPEGTNDDKLEWLRDRLTGNSIVYNWKYDPRYTVVINSVARQPDRIEEYVKGKPNIDDLLIHIETGDQENDYGEFVLITIVRDTKLSPHPTDGAPETTLGSRWKGRYTPINIIDDNLPLIVFDTAAPDPKITDSNLQTGNSPEENTFPKLINTTEIVDDITKVTKSTFEINGYTLRENSSTMNKVQRFRMAWIPQTLLAEGDEKAIIKQVENFLRWYEDPLEDRVLDLPDGVQYWIMDDEAYVNSRYSVDGDGIITDPDPLVLGEVGQETRYIKQVFRKKFDILGGADDPKSSYKNFTYDNKRENETKVFVFCAIDNMQKAVFRTLRLLGNKTPPALAVYDITGKNITLPTSPTGIPSVYDKSPTGAITPEYITARKEYNERQPVYDALRGPLYALDVNNVEKFILADNEKAIPFQSYPRGTQLAYWIIAEKDGDLAIESITMEDVTLSGSPQSLGSKFNATDRAVSYVEFFPEVTQRVFLFTAVDTLGNKAEIQRTIAITNAAMLSSITTDRQNGTYGIGEVIKLKANFDGQIGYTGDPNGILLNVRYKKAISLNPDPNDPDEFVFDQLPLARANTLSLEFDFTVEEGYLGQLETLYDNIEIYLDDSNIGINRPITIRSGSAIIDTVRNGPAYTPTNTTGFFWTTDKNSLQDSENGKEIFLDGIRPKIISAEFSGKAAWATNEYYFKSGESITITLKANKDIRTVSDTNLPRLQYMLRQPNNGTVIGTYTANFNYQRPVGANGMAFVLSTDDLAANLNAELYNISLVSVDTIVDDVNNKVVDSTVTQTAIAGMLPANLKIYIDKVVPPAPVTRIDGATIPNEKTYYNTAPVLTIDNAPAASEPWTNPAIDRQYSLDGGLTWTTVSGAIPSITTNGQYNLKTRYIDRAGNEGATRDQYIHVNLAFPRLLGINVGQPNGTYIAGQQLDFTLEFDDKVSSAAGQLASITITIADTSTSTTDTPGGTSPTYSIQLQLSTAVANSNTITFSWINMTGKDMLNGLRVTAMDLSGLRDIFNNSGPTSANINCTTSGTVTIGGVDTAYNISGIKVSTITPTVRSREPQNANGRTGNLTLFSNDPDPIPSSPSTVAAGSISTNNRIIRLNFSKPMQRGNGTITIRPQGNYAIPPVLENEGYYLKVDFSSNQLGEEATSASAVDGYTWVAGFSDIFNNVNNADKTSLIGSTSMSAPALSPQTGLSVGPYLKTTHGLKQGAGYTGNYGNADTPTVALPGINAPGPRGTDRMVPDVTTKWVLRYDIADPFATTAPVSGIRTALDNAKFRWQEIAVTSTAVTFSGNTVVITLPEPLLPGLQWTLHYDEGTFTDTAGNKAVGSARGAYWFWSRGVQRPIIRVDRKSYDARNSTNMQGSYTNYPYSANGHNGTITSFNTIAYRIVTETPGARIFYATQLGSAFTVGTTPDQVVPIGSIIGGFTGRATLSSQNGPPANIDTSNNINWDGPKAGTGASPQYIGRWVRPNLIYRHDHGGSYQLMLETGNRAQLVGGIANNNDALGGRYLGFRSFNKDATVTELDGLTIPTGVGTAGTITATFTYDNSGLQASKNYVVAQARVDHANATYTTPYYTSQKGYEGVFRTVVALNQAAITTDTTNANPILLCGTNVRSGLPTIAAFPVRDGVAESDARYVKAYFRDGNNYYWVSSEMVCQWFVQNRGSGQAGSSYGRMGDTDDWQSAGYGDLTYAFNMQTW